MDFKLILGYNCNMNCSYCYQKHNRCQEEMPKEVLDKFIERFNLLKGHNSINFFGGEPLLYIDKIKYVLDRISRETEISISTNGLLRKEFYELQEYAGRQIGNLLSNKTHNNYHKLNNLSCFRYVVTKDNLKELTDKVVEFLGFEYKENLQFKYDMSRKWEIDEIKRLEEINKVLKNIVGKDFSIELPVDYNAHFGCFVSGSTVSIDVNGNYLACHRNRNSIIGNIFKDDFKPMHNETCIDPTVIKENLYSYGKHEFKGISVFHRCD